MSCHGRNGITSSCSMVPASLSQAGPPAGTMIAIIITARVSMATTSKSTLRRAGLYQVRRPGWPVDVRWLVRQPKIRFSPPRNPFSSASTRSNSPQSNQRP